MVKPTVLQKVFNRPSQTYSFPQEKAYFSAKQEIARAATDSTQVRSQAHPSIVPNGVDRSIYISPAHDVPALSERSQRQISGPTNFDNDRDPGESDDSNSEFDVFYTPNASPRTSMASAMSPSPQPSSPSETRALATRTSLSHANISTTSISSSALDAHSLFSDIMSESESTHITTPLQSINGYGTKSNKQPNGNGYATEEWARDVRWLVPTPVKSTTTPKPRNQQRADEKPTQVPKPNTRTKPNTPITKNISKTTPSIMTSMATLLEDDELQGLTYLNNGQPRSAVLISPPKQPHRSQQHGPRPVPRPRMPSGSPSSSSTTSTSTSLQPKHPSPLGPSATVQQRRSHSLGHAESSYGGSKAPPSIGHGSTTSHTSSRTASSRITARTSKYASSSADPYDPATTSLPTFTPGSLPSQGTPGYTSLVLPRAPVPLSQFSNPSKGILSYGKDLVTAVMDNEGRVDLTKSGAAQTTIASVEVLKGLSGGMNNRKLLGLFRRGSTSSSARSGASIPNSRGRSQSEDGVGLAQNAAKHLIPESPLGFTSYRPPPKYVPSNSVLVQVWAVGVDSVDRLLVFGSNSSQGQRVQPGQLRSQSSRDLTSYGPMPNLPSALSSRAPPKRIASLRSAFGKLGRSDSSRQVNGSIPNSGTVPNSASGSTGVSAGTPAADVGYIPGRSFVGRVLECGWEVDPEEIAKRGDWVIGLTDIKKSGALTEFIVVDRHRVHRVPYPHMDAGLAALVPSQPQNMHFQDPSRPGPSGSRAPTRSNSVRTIKSTITPQPLSLEELSLLPLCGLAAYRAVRTFAFAFSSAIEAPSPGLDGNWGTLSSVDAYDASSPENSPKGKGKGKEREGARERHSPPRLAVKQRRALVLGGHDGAGAIAVQMLVKAGWRVCVQVPYSCLLHEAGIKDVSGAEHETVECVDDGPGSSEGKDRWIELGMRRVEERVREWGGEEVVFDDGEVVGGVEDAGLADRGPVVRVIDRLRGDGDVFDAVLDTVGGKEIWEASERLLKSVGKVDAPVTPKVNGIGKRDKNNKKVLEPVGMKQFTTLVGDYPGRAIPTTGDHFRAGLRSFNFGRGGGDGERGGTGSKVGYAWINLAQDVDWEGENVRETLSNVLRTAVQDGVRPWVGKQAGVGGRAVPFERAPKVFIPGTGSLLAEGGTAVVKVAG